MTRLMMTVLLGGAMAVTALGDDGDFQWQGQMSPGQLLQIRGVFGAIHAEGTWDNTASIMAHKTANMSDPAAVSVRVVPFDGGLMVCAMYPDADPNRPNTCNPPGMDNFSSVTNNDVQVEFTIKVPQGVRFTANSLRGDIQATSLTADVSVNTIVGALTVSTTGGAQATTRAGSISAVLGTVAWTGVHLFETGTGNVDVQIPADASVSVRANTIRGAITSDFPITIRNTFGSAMAFGTLAMDGRSLRLSTDVGNITLRQGPASMQ